MHTLLNTVYIDLLAFLEDCNELFFNERDFQMHLAVCLRNTRHYDDVDVEYFVPYQELNGYKGIWGTEQLRLDVVVSKDGVYVPIELKYKTKSVSRQLPRFGEHLSESIPVMKSQGAQDLGRYNFWKDVRRVEMVRGRFKAVPGGFAVFMTNDKAYLTGPREESIDALFSMKEGKHETLKRWSKTTGTAASNPNFEVEKEYSINWNSKAVDGVELHYCIVAI